MDASASAHALKIELAGRARRATAHMIKTRARQYARRPMALDVLHRGLSFAHPDTLIAVAAHLLEQESRAPRRWLGFGGEIGLVNARAALLLGRALRRAAHPPGGTIVRQSLACQQERAETGTNGRRTCSADHPLNGSFAMTSGLLPPEAALRPASFQLADRLFATRRHSLDLAAPLSAEDQVVQANDDASPTKWHLAHVTWFFETFLLKPYLPGYRLFDPAFPFCFNSYYEAEGARHPRGARGMLTRPNHDEVMAYRQHVDDGLALLLASDALDDPQIATLIEIGINHEQQHQELLLTDILSLFASQPLHPAYRDDAPMGSGTSAAARFAQFDGGIDEIGHAGDGFAFDNESPRHRALIHPFALSDRLVTNDEWLAFIDEGGYRRASLWLADGWTAIKTEDWSAPLYWEHRDGAWQQMSLYGRRPLDGGAPVTNISFYEADAFARWAGHRLPTEFEWEHAARLWSESGASTGPRAFAPCATGDRQMFGQVWQWTQSAYLPYPGYRPPSGAIGEYNGKFMVSQQVLRGSSCATPPGHERRTYRNFFYPHQRWQFTGLRLASDR